MSVKSCFAKLAFLCVLISNQSAAMTIEAYKKEKVSSRDLVDVYITGVAEGYSWLNTYLSTERGQPVYCPPRDLTLNTDNYISIIDSYIEIRNLESDVPVEVALLYGLRHTFACD